MSLLILLVASWCGVVSLQHISSVSDYDFDSPERSFYLDNHPFINNPYENPYANINEAEFYKNDIDSESVVDHKTSTSSENINYGDFYKTDDMNPESPLKDFDSNRIRRWIPNLVDTDKTLYIKVDNKKDNSSPFAIQALQEMDGTKHMSEISEAIEEKLKPKRNFSPWGGKRSSQSKISPDRDGYHYTWSWKRSPGQDSNMPKRVRFSPWGGKRSGSLIFKPSKTPKIIYTALVPELWFHRFNSNRSPTSKTEYKQFPFKGVTKKRYPFKMLKYKNNEYDFLKHNHFGSGFPFYDFLEPSGMNMVEPSPKKDGKRKVKFSAWGGKRSPPVIGPVWTPSMENVKDKAHRTIFVVADDSEKNLRSNM